MVTTPQDIKKAKKVSRVEKIKEQKGIDKVEGIIASPDISKNALKMLKDFGFTHKKVEPPKYLERYNRDQKSLADF